MSATTRNKLSEKHLEDIVVAALVGSPLFSLRSTNDFDPLALLDRQAQHIQDGLDRHLIITDTIQAFFAEAFSQPA